MDGLILLSGFLLFLPHAGCRREGTKPPSVLAFYRNRLWRILPSYLLAVLAAYFLFALPQGSYASEGARRLDLWSHLTLTQTFFLQPYYGTPLNGVLWTVCIEMQFYLLFPLLARWTRKKPGLTLGLMMAAGWLYRAFIYYKVEDTAMYINQLPAFLDVYALGMLGAMGYEAGRAFLEKCAPQTENSAAMGGRRRAGPVHMGSAANSPCPVYDGAAKHGLAAAGAAETPAAAGSGAAGLHSYIRLPAPPAGMAARQSADALAVRADVQFLYLAPISGGAICAELVSQHAPQRPRAAMGLYGAVLCQYAGAGCRADGGHGWVRPMGKVVLLGKEHESSRPSDRAEFQTALDRSRFSFHNKKRKLRNF